MASSRRGRQQVVRRSDDAANVADGAPWRVPSISGRHQPSPCVAKTNASAATSICWYLHGARGGGGRRIRQQCQKNKGKGPERKATRGKTRKFQNKHAKTSQWARAAPVILLRGHDANAVVGVAENVLDNRVQVAVGRCAQEEPNILLVLKLVIECATERGRRAREPARRRPPCTDARHGRRPGPPNELLVRLAILPLEDGEEDKGILGILRVDLGKKGRVCAGRMRGGWGGVACSQCRSAGADAARTRLRDDARSKSAGLYGSRVFRPSSTTTTWRQGRGREKGGERGNVKGV